MDKGIELMRLDYFNNSDAPNEEISSKKPSIK